MTLFRWRQRNWLGAAWLPPWCPCPARYAIDLSMTAHGSVGRGDRIRTYDPLLPKQMRYQTALHPDRRIVGGPDTDHQRRLQRLQDDRPMRFKATARMPSKVALDVLTFESSLMWIKVG